MTQRVLRREALVRVEHEALLQEVGELAHGVLVLRGTGSLQQDGLETLLGLGVGDQFDDGLLRHGVLRLTPRTRSHQRLEAELEVLREHGLAVHVLVRLDVSLHHLVRHVALHVLDHTQHVVIAHAGKGHCAGEQLAQRAARRPHVDSAVCPSPHPCTPTVLQTEDDLWCTVESRDEIRRGKVQRVVFVERVAEVGELGMTEK